MVKGVDFSDKDKWLEHIGLYYETVISCEELKLRLMLIADYKNDIIKHRRKADITRLPDAYKRHMLVIEKTE